MSDTLSSITLDVLTQYRLAGHHLIRAYRGGGERLLRGLHAQGTKLFGEHGSRDRLAQLMLRSLDTATNAASRTVDGLARKAAAGIERVRGTTDQLEAKLDASGLEMVGALHRSAANASLQIASKVSQLSGTWSDRVAGGVQAGPVSVPVRTPRPKASRRVKNA